MRPKSEKVTKAEYESLAALRYSLRRFLRFSEEAARAARIAPQQYQALLAIKGFPREGHITVGELAEHLQIRHHSAVGLVDRLVAKGFIDRKPDQSDRRLIHLFLTRRSEGLLARLASAHKEQLRRSGPEIEALLKSLRQSTD
jgi:Transcriptional regulators